MARQPRIKVVILSRWTNDFTGLSWVTYTDQHGCEVNVCTVESFLNARRKSSRERRAEALREITRVHGGTARHRGRRR
jgi:hypothetical protein